LAFRFASLPSPPIPATAQALTLPAIVFGQIRFQMIRLTIGLLLITTSTCFTQSLHDDIKQTYDFSPGKLTRDEQNKKIPLMDDFWKKVNSDTSKYLNELRTELQADGNPKFFYFEGGQLLLSISEKISDQKIVLSAVLKSDPTDIDRRTYIKTLNFLAKSNLNTTEAALRILDEKDFKFFIPEHAFYFNQGYSLTYALFPTNPTFFETKVIERFKSESDVNAKKSIVTLLWFTNSCTGNKFLTELTTDTKTDKEVTDYAKDLLTRKLKKDKYYKGLEKMSFEQLTDLQKISTSRMSDEAIYELDYITKLLRKNNCRQQ
jgi:hypothetical protein